MKDRFLSGLVICLLSIVATTAQAQFRFDSWTTDNGLPQASVNSILQTRDGYLWLTTYGGLVRYDGVRFQNFNTGNTEGLKTSRFEKLYEDREGTLWITTEGQGVVRYKDGRFTTFSIDQGLPDCMMNFRRYKDGNMVIQCTLTNNVGALYRLTGETFSPYTPPDGEPLNYSFQKTPDGSVWYWENERLRKFENGRMTVDLAPDFKVKRVFEDSQGRVWIAADGTTVLFMLKDGQLTSYSTKDGLFDARFITPYEDRQKRVWFGTNAGLMMFENGKFTTYSPADGLARGDVISINQDREGTLWVGTTGGLTRVTTRTVASYSAKDGLAGDNVYPITEDRAGRIWIGSWPGLTVYENGAFQNVGARLGLAQASITAFYEDRDGNFWIGGLGFGVGRIKNGQITIYSPNELGDDYTRAVSQDREGNVWFGIDDGLVKFKDESFTKYKDVFSGKRVYALYADGRGQLWIGTDSGLTVYKDGVFTPLTQQDGFAGGMVRVITEDADGSVWIGMYDSGLYRFKDGRFARITTNDGLFDNGAFQILEDARGNFWISCNLGIYRVRKSELNDLADGRIRKVTSVPYNKRDGMLNSECNGGTQPTGVKASDGRLWFPTQQGVAVIDPEAVPVNPEPPPVVIQSLTVDTKPVDIRTPADVQPGQAYLEINYAGLSFINPELVKFKYRLEGLDDEWIDAETRRTAYFTHLPPGAYTFRVIAANRDGVWNEQGATLAITVLPPFYQTWWFLMIATVLVAAIAYLIYNRRIQILKRAHAVQETFSRQLIESQEAERKRIAAGLHDNLGQHLIIIKNWASLGLNFTDKDAPVREQLGEISTTAVQALNEVREIIYDLRPYQLETIGLTSTIKFMAEQVAASSGINFTTRCDELDGLFSPEDEVTFYRMVQECVSNIVKHSQAANAEITIKRDGAIVSVKIADDGKGFTVEAPATSNNGGFGLKGLAERVRMLGGTLKIDPVPGRGTTITVNIETRER